MYSPVLFLRSKTEKLACFKIWVTLGSNFPVNRLFIKPLPPGPCQLRKQLGFAPSPFRPRSFRPNSRSFQPSVESLRLNYKVVLFTVIWNVYSQTTRGIKLSVLFRVPVHYVMLLDATPAVPHSINICITKQVINFPRLLPVQYWALFQPFIRHLRG